MNAIYSLLIILLLLLCTNCEKRGSTLIDDAVVIKQASDRIIKFSGYDWVVRNTKIIRQGPGPNFFSDTEDNVWVDEHGRLHLKITQRGGIWYCAGITMKNSLSYGKYTFYVNSDITMLDDNVVAGLFTYLTDLEEIDVEFGKWSVSTNAQFAVQPSDKIGNKVRFEIPSNTGPTAHSFNWQKDKIVFESTLNSTTSTESLFEWEYKGFHIPKDDDERLKINLWLFKGQMPKSLKEQEIVLDSVSYTVE